MKKKAILIQLLDYMERNCGNFVRDREFSREEVAEVCREAKEFFYSSHSQCVFPTEKSRKT